MLFRNTKLKEVIGLPSNVFSGATVDTIILITEKSEYSNQYNASNVLVKTFGKKQPIFSIQNPLKEFYTTAKEWFEQDAFNIQLDYVEKKLISKIEYGRKKMAEVGEMYSGVKVYEVGKGKPAQTPKIREDKPFTSKIRTDGYWLPLFDGKHIGRYQLLWNQNNWIKYGEWIAAPRNPENFEGEKVLIRKITSKTLIATYIPETSYCNTLLFVLKLRTNEYSYKSILAVLNSSLIGWYFRKKFQINDDDTFPQIMIRDILQFPIPVIDKTKDADLTKLVDQLLTLNAEKAETKLQTKILQLDGRIEYCEKRINEIVYQLYGLTDEEIKIVEGL